MQVQLCTLRLATTGPVKLRPMRWGLTGWQVLFTPALAFQFLVKLVREALWQRVLLLGLRQL